MAIASHPGTSAGGDFLYLGNAPTSLGVILGNNPAAPLGPPPLQVIDAAAPPFNALANGQPITTGGPYAPLGGSFITALFEPGLPQSRQLAADPGLVVTDFGPLGPIVISLDPFVIALLFTLENQSFITVNSLDLPNERILAAGTGITITDGGALGSITVSLNASTSALLTALGSASLVTTTASAGLANERVLTAGAGITVTDNGPNSTVVIAALGGSGTMVLTTITQGPTGVGGSFVVPADAIAPRMIAAGGGGGGGGGNDAGVGGPGGAGGASRIELVRPGDTISWSFVGGGGFAGNGGAAPVAAGNGGDTRFAINGAPTALLKGGQGGLNILVQGSFYEPGLVPDAFHIGTSYATAYNGAFTVSSGGIGGGLGLPGADGPGVLGRGGGGSGGASSPVGSGGGGGGGASALARGGNGGQGANSVDPPNIRSATPGAAGSLGSGGGGGGGGGPIVPFEGAGGGAGGDGVVRVEYWIFTP